MNQPELLDNDVTTKKPQAATIPTRVIELFSDFCHELNKGLIHSSSQSGYARDAARPVEDWFPKLAIDVMLHMLQTSFKKEPSELARIVNQLLVVNDVENRMRQMAQAENLDFDKILTQAEQHFAGDKIQPRSTPLSKEELDYLYLDDRKASDGELP